MHQHARFTLDTGVQVYFRDPKSPWQRGSNETTNGPLHQYLPRGTELSGHSQTHLNAVARELKNALDATSEVCHHLRLSPRLLRRPVEPAHALGVSFNESLPGRG